MKLLVTGANGFIGKNVRDRTMVGGAKIELHQVFRNPIYLQDKKNDFCADLTQEDEVRMMMDKIQPDTILHLAGNPLVKLNEKFPTKILDDNIKSTQLICHYAPKGCRVIFMSSIIVYGDYKSDSKIKCLELDRCEPTSVYGVTKLASEGIVNTYTKMGNIKGVNLRLCATCGPHMTHGVIFDFIKKLQSDTHMLHIIGDAPGSKKPFLHISDCYQAIELFAHYKRDVTGTFNVCANDEITVEQLAYAVMKATGINKDINWLGEKANWKGDNKILHAANSGLKNFGWNPYYETSTAAVEAAVRDYLWEQECQLSMK